MYETSNLAELKYAGRTIKVLFHFFSENKEYIEKWLNYPEDED